MITPKMIEEKTMNTEKENRLKMIILRFTLEDHYRIFLQFPFYTLI